MSLKQQFKGFGWWLLFCCVLLAIVYWHFGQRQLVLRHSAYSLRAPVTVSLNEDSFLFSVTEKLQTDQEQGFSFIHFPQTPTPITVTIRSKAHGIQSCQVEVASSGCELEAFLTATKLSCSKSCGRSF